VLLLNTVSVVYESKPKSHYNLGWEKITEVILASLSQKYGGKRIFMLWGKEAQAFKKKIIIITLS
jgi:uracil-DNA glycosylase